MRERIDLDFEVTRDPYTRLAKIRRKVFVSIFFLLKNRSWIFFRHRALFLIRPTIDMSGVYTCKVTNNDVDDYDNHKIGDDEINSCVMAFGLYCSISLPLQIPFLLKILFLHYCLAPFSFLLCSLVLWTLPEDQKDIGLPRLLFMVSAMMIVPKTLASMVLVKNST